MDYILTEYQVLSFLRRRFSFYELDNIINTVQQRIKEGDNVENSIYGTIRYYISLKKFDDINHQGTEQDYQDSYLKYEIPLVAYVKSKLN
jgi:hypothetical protein